jgi:hypothetical protein
MAIAVLGVWLVLRQEKVNCYRMPAFWDEWVSAFATGMRRSVNSIQYMPGKSDQQRSGIKVVSCPD